MTAGAFDTLGEQAVRALVVTGPGPASAIDVLENARVRVIESAHPRPDARSLVAGMAVVQFVAGLPRSARLLWLISGGASSLVEVLCVDWWMYLLMAAAAIVLLNVLLVVALVAFRRDGELSD